MEPWLVMLLWEKDFCHFMGASMSPEADHEDAQGLALGRDAV